MVDQTFRDSDPSRWKSSRTRLVSLSPYGIGICRDRKVEWPDLSDLAERARGHQHCDSCARRAGLVLLDRMHCCESEFNEIPLFSGVNLPSV